MLLVVPPVIVTVPMLLLSILPVVPPDIVIAPATLLYTYPTFPPFTSIVPKFALFIFPVIVPSVIITLFVLLLFIAHDDFIFPPVIVTLPSPSLLIAFI